MMAQCMSSALNERKPGLVVRRDVPGQKAVDIAKIENVNWLLSIKTVDSLRQGMVRLKRIWRQDGSFP